MGLIIDILAIGVVIICGIIAYFKGFVKTFFGFVSIILSIILASLFSRPLATAIKDSTEIDEWIVSGITSLGIDNEREKSYTILSGDNISGEIYIENEAFDEKNLEYMNKDILSFINNLPDTVEASLNLGEAKEEVFLSIGNKVSDIVIGILSWVIIYFCLRIIFAILIIVFNGIMQIPILKSINNIAGLAIGLLLGVFRVYLVLAIVYFISSITNWSDLTLIINQSFIVSAMYNHNLIIGLIF